MRSMPAELMNDTITDIQLAGLYTTLSRPSLVLNIRGPRILINAVRIAERVG